MRDYNADLYKKSCTVCGGETYIWGCMDFNKSCEELNNKYLDYCGVPIYYLQCHSCKHIFTPDFDDWDLEDFAVNIYNENYIDVDPEYNGERSLRDVEWFTKAINHDKNLAILDYGAGPAVLGRELNRLGYQVDSWDPFWGTPPSWNPSKKFDLITAFEVLEHSPDPRKTLVEMHAWLKDQGKILITTLANDILKGQRDTTYWYIAPRNGHVAMFSNLSIEKLFAQVGMRVKHLAWNTHLAYY